MKDIENEFLNFSISALKVVIVLVVGFLLVKLIARLVRNLLTKTRIDSAASGFIISVLKVALYFVVAVTALATIGVNVASLVAALGAAALTAGLALQDCLSNVVSGLIILINKPFVSGDTLEFEGQTGRVETINVFSTTIHTYDNKIVTIPNSRLTKNNVVNCTMGDKRRVDLSYCVSYEDDLAKVKQVIYDLVSGYELVSKDPPPKVYVGKHLENGIEISVFLWTQPENYFDVYYYMQENVKIEFDKNGITIPYPHIVVRNNK